MGPRYLADVLETMGDHVDALKFAGGSFTLMPECAILETAHEHDVFVSTGGFIEHVLTQGPDAVKRYIDERARLGFDIVEISAGFISIPTDDILRLVEHVQRAGLKAPRLPRSSSRRAPRTSARQSRSPAGRSMPAPT